PTDGGHENLSASDPQSRCDESAQRTARREKDCYSRLREPARVESSAGKTVTGELRRRVAKLFSAWTLADDLAVQPASSAENRRSARRRNHEQPGADRASGALSEPEHQPRGGALRRGRE